MFDNMSCPSYSVVKRVVYMLRLLVPLAMTSGKNGERARAQEVPREEMTVGRVI